MTKSEILAEMDALQVWFAGYRGGNKQGWEDRNKRYEELLEKYLASE